MENETKHEVIDQTGDYERFERISSGAIKIADERKVSNGAICVDFD